MEACLEPGIHNAVNADIGKAFSLVFEQVVDARVAFSDVGVVGNVGNVGIILSEWAS